jgi:hypothetical protein
MHNTSLCTSSFFEVLSLISYEPRIFKKSAYENSCLSHGFRLTINMLRTPWHGSAQSVRAKPAKQMENSAV